MENFKVKKIKDKEKWDNFTTNCKRRTFLHSWEWGEFEKNQGTKIWRLGVFYKNKLKLAALVLKREAKRGKFLLVPHGPLVGSLVGKKKEVRTALFKSLVEKLKEIGRKEKCWFLRVAPLVKRNKKNKHLFSFLGFKEAPMHIHPEVTWELNLEQSEDDILMDMRKNTRYYVRKGLKNDNLEVEKQNSIEGIKAFNKIYQKTAERHDFVPFSLSYLKDEFEVFSPDNVLVLHVKHKGELLASSIIVMWGERAFYHQGASIRKNNLPTSYLLQWESIKEAKKNGCKKYNFWGITESDDKDHPFWGLSLFKRGFGGYKKRYLKTQDYPLSWRYYLTRVFEFFRKRKRGF